MSREEGGKDEQRGRGGRMNREEGGKDEQGGRREG